MPAPSLRPLFRWTGTAPVLAVALLAAPILARAAAATPPAVDSSAPRPNIIVILADDWGYAYPGFTGGLVETPNLDKLQAKSLNFTQFYVLPVCTPSRSALLTGRYPFHTGTEVRFEDRMAYGMLTDERTVAQGLHDAGYHTAIFGKWHLGAWHDRHLPLARGFDYQYGFYGAMVDYYRKFRLKNGPPNYEAEPPPGPSYLYDWHRNQQPLVQSGYTTYLIADEVVAALDRHKPGEPFFYYIAFNAAHGPGGRSQVPPEYQHKYKAYRHTQAFCMDQSVGRIMETLEKNGLMQNTLMVFLNDNGLGAKSNTWSTDNAPYRGGKGSYYEGGLRVNCFVHWPAQFSEHRDIDALVDVVDFYPTLLKLAGGSLDQPLPLDGVDMMPLMKGQVASIRDEIAYSTHTIRKGDWKLITKEQGYPYPGEDPGKGDRPTDELYNIATDPAEKRNVAADNPEVVARLRQALKPYAASERPPEQRVPQPTYDDALIFGDRESQSFSGVRYIRGADGRHTIAPKQP